jgi:hypothetical protein
MAQNLGEAVLRLTTDGADLSQGLTKAEKEARDKGKSIAEGIGVATAAAIAFGTELIRAWGESEDAAIHLSAAIRSTGQAGSVSSRALLDLASELQATTRFSDDSAASAEALLISIGRFTEEGVKQALPALADYASATGVDLVTAAQQMAQAIEGGRNIFARFGIEIDADQPKAEKFDVIIQGLNEHFGGTAKILNESTNGALISMANALNDLQEAGGRALAVFIRPFAEIMGPIVEDLAAWIHTTFDLRDAQKAVADGSATLDQRLVVATAALADAKKKADDATKSYGDYVATIKDLNEITPYQSGNVATLTKRLNDAQHTVTLLTNGIGGIKAEIDKGKGGKSTILENIADTPAVTVLQDATAAIDAGYASYKSWADAQITFAPKSTQMWDDDQRAIDGATTKMKVLDAATEALAQDYSLYGSTVTQLGPAIDHTLADQKAAVTDLVNEFNTYSSAVSGIVGQLNADFAQFYKNQSNALSADSKKKHDALDDWYAAQLAALGDMTDATQAQLDAKKKLDQDYADGKKKLDDDYDTQSSALKKKQWQTDKGIAMGNTVINTAQAIVKSLADPGGPAGIILSVIMGALGAIQLALIAAEPAPTFASGADFVVPPGYEGDTYPMRVSSGEHVQVTPAGGGGGGGDMIHVVVNLDSQPILDAVTRGSRNKRLLITARSVVP